MEVSGGNKVLESLCAVKQTFPFPFQLVNLNFKVLAEAQLKACQVWSIHFYVILSNSGYEKTNPFSPQHDYKSEVDCLSLSYKHPYLAYSLMARLTRTVRRRIIRFALYLSYYISAYAITQLSSSYGFLTQIRHKNMKQLMAKSSISVRKIWCNLCWLLN